MAELAPVDGERRAGQHWHAGDQNELREPSHLILRRVAVANALDHESYGRQFKRSRPVDARSNNERQGSSELMRCENDFWPASLRRFDAGHGWLNDHTDLTAILNRRNTDVLSILRDVRSDYQAWQHPFLRSVVGKSRSTVITTIGNALATNPKIAIGLLSPVGLLFALPVLLWAFSFVERFGLEKCSIGSISEVEYQRILSRAGEQRWTVWPGLSNGVFWPSDMGFHGPTEAFKSNIDDRLLSRIRELAGSGASMSRQLASGHAVMRSMGAEYVHTLEVPDTGPAASHRYFQYFLPQVRFAPACVLCLIWWYTTIDVIFSHDLATDRYELQAVNVVHAGLKGSPRQKPGAQRAMG